MDFKKIKKKEILRFLVGGGSAVLVDYLTYKLMLHAGVDRSLAKALSYILGAIVGFLLNKFWTFECKTFSISEILRYIILYTFSAFINTCVNHLVLKLFALEFFAFLSATGVSTIINFLGQKFFVFRHRITEEST